MDKINTIYTKHKLFQQRLQGVADLPKTLHYFGDILPLFSTTVAIVGSRKPTAYGQEMTYTLAYQLASRGVCIVSGLAIGVDGLAHQAALDAGGRTVAVLGSGLGHIYPQRHRALARRIVQSGGALITEYSPGMPPLPHQFIARNRLIAGLADVTIITEAAQKSGSLHTAQFAIEAGRTVMAVPGQATNPMASGCLQLIKDGALVATSQDDVLLALGEITTSYAKSSSTAVSSQEEVILQLISQGVRHTDSMLIASGLQAAALHQVLSQLEIQGILRQSGAGEWMRAP